MLLSRRFVSTALLLSSFLAAPLAGAGPVLRVNGSTTVNPVAVEAAEKLRAAKGLDITVDTQGGSSGGISGIGDHSIDIGMSSKAVSDEDRKKFPAARLVETNIGQDAVALVVSGDVWAGGVRAVSKQQLRDIYEGKITNWKQLGGPDRRVVFFNKEPGRGTWEVFANWLYGAARSAPDVSHPEVGGNEEGRNKVRSTKGAITQLSYAWVRPNDKIKALALKLDDGSNVEASATNIANGTYPLSRPLTFITDGAPAGTAKVFIDYVLSAEGQKLVTKHGYLTVRQLSGKAAVQQGTARLKK